MSSKEEIIQQLKSFGITDEQIQAAESEAQASGMSFEDAVVAMGLIAKDKMDLLTGPSTAASDPYAAPEGEEKDEDHSEDEGDHSDDEEATGAIISAFGGGTPAPELPGSRPARNASTRFVSGCPTMPTLEPICGCVRPTALKIDASYPAATSRSRNETDCSMLFGAF